MRIFVFDWDDTLMATTHFQKIFSNVHSPVLEASVTKMLKFALEHGQVLIITNASDSWVQDCIESFFPNCKDLLNNVIIYSTISMRLEWVPPECRKTVAFKTIINPMLRENKYKEVLFFGDNLADRQAAITVKETFPQVWNKSVLLIHSPTLTELIMQHELLIQVFTKLIKHEEHLDLRCTRDMIGTITENVQDDKEDKQDDNQSNKENEEIKDDDIESFYIDIPDEDDDVDNKIDDPNEKDIFIQVH